MNFPLLPGAISRHTGTPMTLGVVGGGQLGRMFVHAAQRMGYRSAVLEPDANSPAGLVSHVQIKAAYDDPKGLAELVACCDAVTTEFENVPAQTLHTLAATFAETGGFFDLARSDSLQLFLTVLGPSAMTSPD